MSLDKHIRLYKDTERDSRINKESFSKLVKTRETEILDLRKGKEDAENKLKLCNVASVEKDRQVSTKNQLLQEKENRVLEKKNELEDISERFTKLEKNYDKLTNTEKELEEGRKSLITQLAESKLEAQDKNNQINIAKLERREFQQDVQLIQSKLNEQTLERRLLEKENTELEQKLASLQKGYDDLNKWLVESKKNGNSEVKENVDKLEEIIENVHVDNVKEPDDHEAEANVENNLILPAPDDIIEKENFNKIFQENQQKIKDNEDIIDNLGNLKKVVENNEMAVLPPPKKEEKNIENKLDKLEDDTNNDNVLDKPLVREENEKKEEPNIPQEKVIADFDDLNEDQKPKIDAHNEKVDVENFKEIKNDIIDKLSNKIQKMDEGPVEGMNPRNNRVVENNVINIHENMDKMENNEIEVKKDVNVGENLNVEDKLLQKMGVKVDENINNNIDDTRGANKEQVKGEEVKHEVAFVENNNNKDIVKVEAVDNPRQRDENR